MASVLEYSDYRAYLRDIIATKKENKALSLRAVARKIGVSPSAFSNVLKGARSFSPEALVSIGERLKLSATEQEHLVALCISSTGERPARLVNAIRMRARANKKRLLTGDDFAGVSPAHAVTFIESLRIPSLNQDLEKISEQMGLSVAQLTKIRDSLLEKGVLTIDPAGKLKKATHYFQIAGESSKLVLRTLNKQMLQLAIDRIRPETADERHLGFETFGFSPELLPEAREIINRCLDDLAALSEKSETPTTVYHAGVQFFEVLTPKRRSS